MKAIFIAASTLLLAAACGKASTDCELIVSPKVQNISSGPFHDAYMVTVYAYYLPAADWQVTSYARAEAGILENRRTGELRTHDFAGGQGESDRTVRFRVNRSPVMLVAVDPINKLYAWREFDIPENFPTLYSELRLPVWRSATTYQYTERNWTVVNDALKNVEEE